MSLRAKHSLTIWRDRAQAQPLWLRRMLSAGLFTAILVFAPVVVNLALGSEPPGGADFGGPALQNIVFGLAYGAVHGWVVSRQRRPVDHATTVAAGLVAGPAAGILSGVAVAASMGWTSLTPVVFLLFAGALLGVPLSYWFDAPERRSARHRRGVGV